MNQRETAWESMLEKEINNRKDLEEVVRTLSLVDGLTDQERAQVLAGADLTVCIISCLPICLDFPLFIYKSYIIAL